MSISREALELERIKGELTKEREDHARTRKRLEDTATKSATLQTQLDAFREQNRNSSKELDTERKSRSTNFDNMKELYEKTQKENAQLEEEIETLEARISELEGEENEARRAEETRRENDEKRQKAEANTQSLLLHGVYGTPFGIPAETFTLINGTNRRSDGFLKVVEYSSNVDRLTDPSTDFDTTAKDERIREYAAETLTVFVLTNPARKSPYVYVHDPRGEKGNATWIKTFIKRFRTAFEGSIFKMTDAERQQLFREWYDLLTYNDLHNSSANHRLEIKLCLRETLAWFSDPANEAIYQKHRQASF